MINATVTLGYNLDTVLYLALDRLAMDCRPLTDSKVAIIGEVDNIYQDGGVTMIHIIDCYYGDTLYDGPASDLHKVMYYPTLQQILDGVVDGCLPVKDQYMAAGTAAARAA